MMIYPKGGGGSLTQALARHRGDCSQHIRRTPGNGGTGAGGFGHYPGRKRHGGGQSVSVGIEPSPVRDQRVQRRRHPGPDNSSIFEALRGMTRVVSGANGLK